ncbi:MAG: CoB--CoM heterodisulfide reductase iron-sulfur subunit B family protein [Candidatus Aminicenantes bacterium]|nr:CoB--CoM heterodisulfide reductase iron-sulfur subunit B family protein [Candidatus Aminicenantes bacterium]
MDYVYYPGCSLETSGKAYDESVRFVFQQLGHNLIEIDDWNCCGATYYMATKETISLVISARNLALAEQIGQDLIAPCSSCYTILYKTNKILQSNPILKAKVDQSLRRDNLEYHLSLRIRHPLEVLVNDIGLNTIREKRVVSLEGQRIAPYYGCQIVRPDRGIDNKEDPQMMDELLRTLGAEVVPFPAKVRCCGGMLMTTYPDVALELNLEILACAARAQAEVIVTTCPLCQINLEAYQNKINKKFNTRFHLPVLYFTQILGLALGGTPRQVGLHRQIIPFHFKAINQEEAR